MRLSILAFTAGLFGKRIHSHQVGQGSKKKKKLGTLLATFK